MRSGHRTAAVLALIALAAVPARVQGQQGGGPPRQQVAPDQAPPNQSRIALERQVRARIRRVMRETLRLTDEQVARVERTMLTFEGRRRELLRAERQVRQSLREAMGGAPRAATRGNVDQPAIARGLDSLVVLQRRRIDLIEAEQRELATFLTPLQRAQYFALQENLRRMLEQRRNGAGQADRPARRTDAGQRVPPD